jgi:predicted phosphoribosyltransferase
MAKASVTTVKSAGERNLIVAVPMAGKNSRKA